MLHLNVPAPSDTASEILQRKVLLTIMTVILLEVVVAHAIEERRLAIVSLHELRVLNMDDLEVCYNPWSLRGAWEQLKKC
jgi:hypothetical protein